MPPTAPRGGDGRGQDVGGFLLPGQALEQAFEFVKVACIHVQVQQVAFAVEELVGGVVLHVEEPFDGLLLFLGQVVVRHVLPAHVVHLYHVLPGILGAVVGEIDVGDVVLGQSCIFLGGVLEGFLAWCAPCAPDVEEDYLAFELLENLL